MVQNSHNFLGDVQDVKRDNVRKRRSNKKRGESRTSFF